jgi:hypothetical protein
MSDTRLRELERRWLETGSVGDETAYLHERARRSVGERERLAVVAYLGHEAARVALGVEAPVPSDRPELWNQWLSDWCYGLHALPGWRREPQAYPRAALAAFDASPWFNAQRRLWLEEHPGDLRPEQVMATLYGWTLCPCSEHEDQFRAGAQLADTTRNDVHTRFGTVDYFNGYLLSLWNATNQAYLPDLLFDLADGSAEGHRQMVSAVSRELVPWLLGVADPLRVRLGKGDAP